MGGATNPGSTGTAQRAAYGGGSMAERTPGVWRLRVATVHGQIERTFRGTKTQARRELAKLATEARAMKPAAVPTRTFGQLLDEWMTAVESRGRSPKTLHENRREVETRIRPRLGFVRLGELTAKDLDDAYAAWQAEGLSPSSVHRHAAVISAALTQGVRWGWLDTSPAPKASAPPQRTGRKLVTPTPDQVAKLIRAAGDSDPVMAAAIALAFVTGGRRGELAALRWDDVDLDVGVVRIERSLSEVGGAIAEKTTKTARGRTIALDERAVTLLRRHRDWQRDLSQRADSPLVENPYVLSDNANGGRPVEPSRLTDRFTSIRGRAHIRGVRFHDLRHAHVTQLLGAGIDVKTVSARVGHASARMTLDLYAHALPAGDVAAAAVIGALLPASSA